MWIASFFFALSPQSHALEGDTAGLFRGCLRSFASCQTSSIRQSLTILFTIRWWRAVNMTIRADVVVLGAGMVGVSSRSTCGNEAAMWFSLIAAEPARKRATATAA